MGHERSAIASAGGCGGKWSVVALRRKMVLVWVLGWILGGVGALGLGFVVKEWIWVPLMLIELCRTQGVKGFPFVPFAGQMPAIDEVDFTAPILALRVLIFLSVIR